MRVYYVAGIPYSDELYHHGIIGQKWGVRRYQNRDGSLTAEGRQHYGVKSSDNRITRTIGSAGRAVGNAAATTGRAVSNAAKATASYAGKRFKMKHPSLMTDQELRDYTNRMIQEKNYSDMMRKSKSSSPVRNAAGFVGDILKDGAKTLASAGFKKMASDMTKTRLELENDQLKRKIDNKELKEKLYEKKEGALSKAMRIMNDSNATSGDIQEAKQILQNYSASKNFLRIIMGNSDGQISVVSPKAATTVEPVLKNTNSDNRNNVMKMRFTAPPSSVEKYPEAASWLETLDFDKII